MVCILSLRPTIGNNDDNNKKIFDRSYDNYNIYWVNKRAHLRQWRESQMKLGQK